MTNDQSVTDPQSLADLAKPLEKAGVKVVLVVIGNESAVNNVRVLAPGDDFIVTAWSHDQLYDVVRPTVEVILKGKSIVLNEYKTLHLFFIQAIPWKCSL